MRSDLLALLIFESLRCTQHSSLQLEANLDAAMDQLHSSSLPHEESSPILWASRDLQQPHVLAAIVGIAVLLLVIFCSRIQPKDRHRLPPGPRPWPIIGNLHLVSACPHQGFLKLAKKYGPLLYLKLGSDDSVVVSSPQIAQDILKTHDIAFASRTESTHSKIMFYDGQTVITAPYGPFWRYGRKVFTLEMLTNKRIQEFQIVRKEEVLSALSSMIEEGQAVKAVYLVQEFKRLLMNSFTRMMMKKSYFGPHSSVTDKKEATEMAESLEELIKLSGSVLVGDFIPLLKPFDLPSKSRMRAVAKNSDKFLQRIIDERRQEFRSRKQNIQVMDMLDVLLTRPTGKEEKPFTDDEIKGMLLIVVIAGTDTTSQTVEWAMTQLLKNPNIMKKAQDELDAVVGRNRLVEEADIPNLRYFRLIVKEIYRLHPAAPLLIPHNCVESRQIAGYHIPVNTQVILNIYAIQRDPEVWARPLEFDPERFLSTNIDVHGQDFELLPFGAGRRSCPGKALGMVLVDYILAVLLHACNWSLPPGVNPEDVDLAEAPGFGGHKLNPLQAIASPRLPMDVICSN